MKIQAPNLKDEEFDLTPMIDVVFLLIIFFMVVAAQITEKVPVDVPVADMSKVPEDTSRRMQISVTTDGTPYLGLQPVEIEELTASIRSANAAIEGFKVYLRADADVPHEYVRDVMQACADAGVFNIVFATFQ